MAGHHAGHQPQQAHGRERSGEPGPGAGGLKAPRAFFFIRRKKVRSDERASFLGRRSGGDLAL